MKMSLRSNLRIENVPLQIIGSDRQETISARDGSRLLAYDALVLDAQLRQSLAAVRSLGSRGLSVAALGGSERAPAFSSRWCKQAFICPADEGTEEYFYYLVSLLERFHVGVLIPSSDASVALLRRHREELEQWVHVALAKEPALAIAVSKERTLEVAKRLGVRVPRAISVGKVNEVEAALREVGLPAAVKPVESWSWNNQKGMRLDVQVVTTTEEAQRAVEELTSLGGTTLFQEFIPGIRESVSILYAHGEIYACYAQRHYRVSGGQSTLRRSIAVPKDIGDQVERLVREIDLEGCSEAEFRRDNAGNAYLMEINPRLWASTELGMRSGVDFPYLLYQWSTGNKIDMVKSYRVGVWMRHLRGDITVTSKALKQRGRLGVISPTKAILGFCFSFVFPMRYDYVDWKDPLPILSAIAGSIYEVLERVKSSLRRRKRQ